MNSSYCATLGDSPYFVYKHQDPELPATRFAKPKFTYAEDLNFEQERQRREHVILQQVKDKLLETADRSARRRQKTCKEKTLKVDDRVFIKRFQKVGESKLINKWRGPYRIIAQKSPAVYKLKELATGKITEQHIENIKEKVIMARESEIPDGECPAARLPFPEPEEEEERGRKPRRRPEGDPGDDWIDDTFWLTPQIEDI